MLTIKEIKNNSTTECNACGKVRRRYFEIRYGIPSGFPWQPYSTLPFCASCLRKLGISIEKKLLEQSRKKPEKEKQSENPLNSLSEAELFEPMKHFSD